MTAIDAATLSQLMASPDADHSQLLQSLVLQQRPELASMLTASAGTKTESDDANGQELVRRYRMLAARYRNAVAALEAADAELDAVASAIGACQDCWGEDTDCEQCDGGGAPGWRAPKRSEFNRYIAPVLRRTPEGGREVDTDHV